MRVCSIWLGLLVPLSALAQSTTVPATSPAVFQGQDKAFVAAHFEKTSFRIPMRDGVRLQTTIYVPKDTSTPHPILFRRTPYGIGGYEDGEIPDPTHEMKWFAGDGFIFVVQDVRGRFKSEGEFVHVRPLGVTLADERTDAWDTIDWLIKHVPNHNGRVGIVGSSYPGYYAACATIDPHPALKCAVPQAPIGDWFEGDDAHRNGAFNLAAMYTYMRSFVAAPKKPTTLPTTDGYSFYLAGGSAANFMNLHGPVDLWADFVAHPTYDAFWKARDLRPQLKNVTVPTMTVGGWWDVEDLFGTFACYQSIERQNPGTTNVLVVGPWAHGRWLSADTTSLGDVSFGSNTAVHYRRRIELPFLNYYLKGAPSGDAPAPVAEATVFETGTNQWRTYAEWPPKSVTPTAVHLRANSVLSPEAPTDAEAPFDEYVSDPNKPVPYVTTLTTGVPKEYMTADQRFASQRPDVLVYQSQVLEEPVTVAGPIPVSLNVSASTPDIDVVVKLIDVYPDSHPTLPGYQQLIRGDILRARFRQSLSEEALLPPNAVTPLNLTMPDVNHTFLKGHRLMVQVQSTWFPLFDRNPQSWCNPYTAKPEDYRKATVQVHHTPANPSVLRLPVVRQGQ